MQSQPVLTDPDLARRFTITRRAEKSFAVLGPEEQCRFRRLLQRISSGDQNITWKRLEGKMASMFGVETLWEAKATHKHRLFTSGRNGVIPIIDFVHRGEHYFRRER